MTSADFVQPLVRAGMTPHEAAHKAALFARTAEVLAARTQGDARPATDAVMQWFVPGRIEVLGKHTDYAGGRSLLCAVERGFAVSARARADRVVRVIDIRRGDESLFALDADQRAEPGWRTYPATVVRRLARNFPPLPTTSALLRGADIVLASDLPPAAGLSSSSALIIAIFLVLRDVNGLDAHPAYRDAIQSREDLAAYLGSVENGRPFRTLAGDHGVGTKGGSQDHTAILCTDAGHVSVHGYAPARVERRVPLSDALTFIVASSGIAADKAGAVKERYNHAARRVEAMLECWNAATGRRDETLFDAVHASPGGPEAVREAIRASTHPQFDASSLMTRLDQFLFEALEAVPAGAEALARSDRRAFGDITARSQRAAEAWLDNQIPETIALARRARMLGAIASSAFGAGFGGSVWALVSTGDASAFLERWRDAYRREHPDAAARAEFFATRAGPPGTRIYARS